LGAEISVPTVDGDEKLRIPAGTQAGKMLRLKDKGVPRLRRDGRGDQLVVVGVEIPRSLSADQQELFEKLAESLGTEVSIQERGFLDRVRDLLGGLAD
jgi:molecular chaperone DnaJ